MIKIYKEQIEGGTVYKVEIRTLLSAKQLYELQQLGITELVCEVDTLNRELIGSATTTIWDKKEGEVL